MRSDKASPENGQQPSICSWDSNRLGVFRSAIGSPWWNGKDGDMAKNEAEEEVDPPLLVLTSARAGAPKRGARARALI